jgi:histidinol dehydrogenase
MSASGTHQRFRWTGSCGSLSANDRRGLLDRSMSSTGAVVREQVMQIVTRVREQGDTALHALATELDGVTLETLEVPRRYWTAALDALDPALRQAMERSAKNIQRVHAAFLPSVQEVESEPGIVVGRRPDPLGRVGIYAPGGRAVYPSSVLMGVVPACVAGVGEIIVCSPPTKETGRPSEAALAAAALGGAHRVFALGGAGAIAAMAFGTKSVPRVDRIVGPGNAYVAEAKLQVAHVVGIDSPAGPSELLVLADESADARFIAREMLAQAEHDPLAAVVAVVTSESQAQALTDAVEQLLPLEPRREIIAAALRGQGAVLWATSLGDALAFANAYAAEHLLLIVSAEEETMARVRNAGTVFVGSGASVAFGDYMTGANHVLPTGGLSRAYSGLSTLDFVRWITYQRVAPAAAARLAEDVGVFATAEGLHGHALAARAWQAGSST